MSNFIHEALSLYQENWLLTVLLFSGLHLIASMFSIPGACSVLNFTSGALFGFLPGCALVYALTLLSAFLVYNFGSRFSGKPLSIRYQSTVQRLAERVGRADFLILISLRLSPFVPFCMVNFACGWMRVPLKLFMGTTALGIFFDVTVLNSLGAAVRVQQGYLIAAFVVLVLAAWGLRSFLLKSKVGVRI